MVHVFKGSVKTKIEESAKALDQIDLTHDFVTIKDRDPFSFMKVVNIKFL